MVYREMSDKVEYIRRFSLYRIVEHLVLIALFVVLAVTGLSQKFHALGISQSIIIALGGVDSVRFLHHVAGVFFTALALQHILANFSVIVFRQGEPSMLIAMMPPPKAKPAISSFFFLSRPYASAAAYSYKEKF